MIAASTLRRLWRAARAWTVVAIAALLFFGHLASLHHDLATRHRVCEEHGEWVHDEVASLDADHRAHQDDGAPRLRAIHESAVEAHGHCFVFAASRDTHWNRGEATVVVWRPIAERASLPAPVFEAHDSLRRRPDAARAPPRAS